MIFNEWKQTKRMLTPSEYTREFGHIDCDDSESILAYESGAYIRICKDGYHLEICQDYWISNDLPSLEWILWENWVSVEWDQAESG